MTLLLSCQSINKSFGAQPLFSNLSLGFFAGERLGMIGPNGSGKSTLLKILAGEEQSDDGEISIRKDLKLTYLPQEDSLQDDKTIEENLLLKIEQEDIEDIERYTRLQKVIARADFASPDQKAGELSGGWRKRLAIACAMIQEPDLLLMDEPTNHLDLEGILWLEETLKSSNFAFVVISHDRYFLENCTNRILEINRQYPGGFYKTKGNYSDFLIDREAFLQGQAQQEAVLSNKLRRETEWLRRGPKARTSKARFRIDDAQRLKEELNEVRQRNNSKGSVGIDFNATERKTKRLLETKAVGKSIAGKLLFDNVNFVLSPGSRIGLMGRNGTGKSTLMNLLAGKIESDSGSIRRADDLKIVMFDQKREQINLQEPLRRALAPEGDSVVYQGRSTHVVSWAKRFLFRPDQLDTPVEKLSGGEQARILIARLMLQPADILLLDEPTNDLDIPSLEVLEESLQEFSGAIVLVTHDRFLLDKISNGVLGLDGQGSAELFADYSQWLERQKEKTVESKPTKSSTTTGKKPRKNKKLSYKDQRELDQMEEKIQQEEAKLEEQQQKMESPEVINDPELLQKCCKELQTLQENVEALYARWEELETLQESLQQE